MVHALITGGAGFIGSHLTEAVLARGDSVVVVDDVSTGNAANLVAVQTHPRLRFIQHDLSDAVLIGELVEQADEVYHLAAAVGVALIARKPLESIERNIHPTELLLAAATSKWRSGRPVRFFLASTSEVYGKNPKPVWTEEDDLVFGATTKARWSYGASKAIDEFMVLACHREYGLPIVIGRFFNVVGPRQSGAYGMVLPRFIEAAMAGRPLVVHDDGQQIRCFSHVADVIAAVLKLMQTDAASGRVFNIGSDQPISILDLARKVVAAAGSTSPIAFQSYADAYDQDFEDIRRRVPDVSRLKATIGDRSRFDLDAIIAAVLAEKGEGRREKGA